MPENGSYNIFRIAIPTRMTVQHKARLAHEKWSYRSECIRADFPRGPAGLALGVMLGRLGRRVLVLEPGL